MDVELRHLLAGHPADVLDGRLEGDRFAVIRVERQAIAAQPGEGELRIAQPKAKRKERFEPAPVIVAIADIDALAIRRAPGAAGELGIARAVLDARGEGLGQPPGRVDLIR